MGGVSQGNLTAKTIKEHPCLRSDDLWLPWQSYRAGFNAIPQWQTLRIPFSDFEPYRTNTKLDIRELKRIGIVAIGREFKADLCVGKVGLYR